MDEKTHPQPLFSVSDFIALTNQTLEYAYPSVQIEGEVASFKVNQNKFVFFDLKDSGASVGCFMTIWQLRLPIEDGMKVIIEATPKLTQWGKFSLTVRSIRPSGEGSLKKSFELLKAKLEKEGLFAPERKRQLPGIPTHIGVITSTQAAGYADFVKILNDRWGGVRVDVAHVQVQGTAAPDQMIRALRYFNEAEQPPEIIVLIRGGGSADDLSAFNDELLVREIAASRVPTIVGVGHEVDESLADLVADVRAATPSNAAQIIVPDREEMRRTIRTVHMQRIVTVLDRVVHQSQLGIRESLESIFEKLNNHLESIEEGLAARRLVLAQLDPKRVLERGYALVRGQLAVGKTIEIETKQAIMKAKVETYDQK